METTPAPATATTQTTSAPIVNASIASGVYTDSIDSSPRYRHMEKSEADPASAPPQKLRLMCSYGGHIVPRPHDKTLCYVGGDTRIIVIDRHTSISDLHSRLSKTLLHNQSFLLKYQLPNEDLDSLISVTTDEDLENMVEEYDRLSNGGGVLKQGRLRLFLFPKSQSNIEQLLVESGSAKSEDWFFNALNGKASTVSGGCASDRGFSESSSINNLLGLDEDPIGKSGIGGKDGETQVEGSKVSVIGSGNTAVNHDVHSVPGSPMLDTTSSFGSTNSSPSMANLPPIKVHVEENRKVGAVGIGDQFQQMNVAQGGNVNSPLPHKEELGLFVAPAAVAPGLPVVVGGEYAASRVFSDDERSEHGGQVRLQQAQLQIQGQPQLPQQPVAQIPQKSSVVADLASPDSVSSEGSARNALSRQMQVVYQEPIAQIPPGDSRVTPNQASIKNEPNSIKYQVQPQVQEHGYILSGQFDQNHHTLHHPQQFVHAGNQYIPAGAMPIPSYYPVYAPQQHQHPNQPMIDQPYPFYFMPARPTQAYNLQPQQPTYSELPQSAPASRPQTPPQVPYASTITAPSKPELAAGVYRTTAGGAQQLVQLPSGQHPTQYMGFSQISHPSQSINPIPGVNTPYTYELPDPSQSPMYYTQHLPPQSVAHYQTLATAPASVIPNASAQLPAESMKIPVKTPQT